MAQSHNEIVARWYAGKAGKGFNMSTDGQNLWSYAMIIGRTLSDGTKQVLDVRGIHSFSVSTAKHVSLACGKNTEVVAPIHTRQGYSGWRVFQQNDTVERIRYTPQVWKTFNGCQNAAKRLDNPLLSVTETYGGYTLTYLQHIDKTGHKVTGEQFHNQ